MIYDLFNRVYIPLYSKGRYAPTKNSLGRGAYKPAHDSKNHIPNLILEAAPTPDHSDCG